MDAGSNSTESNLAGGSMFTKQTIEVFLDDLAAKQPTPAGGSVAAVAIAMAAGLVGMAARFSEDQLPDALGIAQAADALRAQALSLAQADARAYQEVLASFKATTKGDPATRRETIRSSLSGAADVPLAIADAGAEVARLAEDVATRGNGNLRGDAITGALLARAGAQACALLVRINLRGAQDQRIARAQRLADIATAAAERVLVEDA